MEVEKPPVSGNRFWPNFYKSKLVVFYLFNALWCTIFAVAITYIPAMHNLTGWVLSAIGFIVTSIILILALKIIGQPLKDLLSAINHISGERSASPPPNPNQKAYEKTGFKQILQTIYEL